MALIPGEETANQIKNLITKIEKAIVSTPFEVVKEHPLISKGSKFRKTVLAALENTYNDSFKLLLFESAPEIWSYEASLALIGERLKKYDK
ncbi:MAG: hypothetical protein A2381_01035 [Bdellovibrionales bacterium RIFOXYB1_FULL_37_110]|nr:MAG: hypothetical protein A2417_01890 [Bdellovibrionales bacterium RIFOXYC1_FULL_37_79]OFZ58802.1 MAG: hypothetical protein A2381_01035 [Bdellovibrionales bacterium RIFOXYB1_FULL_37_110]OFZ64801.1 MAG: hypothetical protein A2577_07035 [Bdellovibrionales bacterium RIFOXYD1_FULL_36_51]